MNIERKKLIRILVKGGYLTHDDITSADAFATKKRIPLLDALFAQELLTKDLLGQAIAEYFGIPYADLNSNPPTREHVLIIPKNVAQKFRIVLYKAHKQGLIIATDHPKQKGLRSALKQLFKNKKVIIAYSLPEDISNAFVHYRTTLQTRFTEIIESQQRVAPELIEEIVSDATTYRASDIHLEPSEKELLVRFRIDGVLQEAGRIPIQYYENILNRIKIMANLRIDEHHSAQDGAVRINQKDGHVDMRVSVVPSLDGEKVVIRLLAEYVKSLSLTDLGLSNAHQEIITAAAAKPFGMILVSGPTGSGKTTTLYSILKIRNHPDVNVTTIEDPVEYKVSGATQIQVNTEANITFAKGLRAIVRQDPDIILVGEIRDTETIEITVNAALTGHLLLSTIHASNASTTIPRLLDMGVEPFLLSSTLELIISQRLVRTICESCRTSYTQNIASLKKTYPQIQTYFKGQTTRLYKGKGCDACGHLGYSGRSAITEIISCTKEMQRLILSNPSTDEIWKLAKKQGSTSLFEDGLQKVKQGTTTLEELLRVAPPQ